MRYFAVMRGTNRPETRQPHYGEHLGDATYWAPYVREIPRRTNLPARRIESGFVGTFPTFIAGDVVVKLFGDGYGGATAYETELAMHRLLAGRAALPAPDIIANGDLFDDGDGWRWPYLVQQRIGGTAWRAARLTDAQATTITEDLGRALAELHRLSPPRGTRFNPGWIQRRRDAANERLREAGWLPEHLLNQVPAYLGDALPAAVLVHADLTADHVFTDGGRLTGIIDWGDAMLADPYYELIALYFNCFDRKEACCGRF